MAAQFGPGAPSALGRTAAVHPSHMSVVVTLPLRHQEVLQARLARLQRRLEPGEAEYENVREQARVEQAAFPGPEGRIPERFLVEVEDTPGWPHACRAIAEMRAEALGVPSPPTETPAVRQTGARMLPDSLQDVWPRVFRCLTARTAELEHELEAAELRLRDIVRPGRVAAVIDLVDDDVAGGKELLASVLRGWEDLHLFMVVCLGSFHADDPVDSIPSASQCTALARAMGLPGTLPPLPWNHAHLADLGYMVPP